MLSVSASDRRQSVGFVHDQTVAMAQELDVTHARWTSVLAETIVEERLEAVATLEDPSA